MSNRNKVEVINRATNETRVAQVFTSKLNAEYFKAGIEFAFVLLASNEYKVLLKEESSKNTKKLI